MFNKKGFTLVELTSVVVLIAILTALATIPINNIIKNTKSDLNEGQKRQIILLAQNWAVDNKESLPKRGQNIEPINVTIEQLYNEGYLEDELVNLMTDEKISKCSYVKISLIDENKNSGNAYTYDFIEEDC